MILPPTALFALLGLTAVSLLYVPYFFGILIAILETGVFLSFRANRTGFFNASKILLVLSAANQWALILCFRLHLLLQDNYWIPEGVIRSNFGAMAAALWIVASISLIIFFAARLRAL